MKVNSHERGIVQTSKHRKDAKTVHTREETCEHQSAGCMHYFHNEEKGGSLVRSRIYARIVQVREERGDHRGAECMQGLYVQTGKF